MATAVRNGGARLTDGSVWISMTLWWNRTNPSNVQFIGHTQVLQKDT